MPAKPLLYTVRVVGCKVNQQEAAQLAAQLEAEGWQSCQNGSQPDLVVVHTCTVTQRADRDSKQHITKAHKTYPQAHIAVSGCLAELDGQALAALPGVKTIVKQADRSSFAALVRAGFDAAQRPYPAQHADGFFAAPGMAVPQKRSRALIKIEDGCDGACTYCRVQLARGKPISRPLPDILAEAKILLKQGYRELVITGVNIGCWQPGLENVVRELAAISGDFRFRLSSVEPQHLTEALMQAVAAAGDKICPHLHLPLQSGDDAVLQAMNRRYTAEAFQVKTKALRALRQDVVLTGDVIVGFPGETEQAFKNSCGLVKACGLARLHVFPFSARPGTRAIALPGRLPEREITARAKVLRQLSDGLARQHRLRRVGSRTAVLLEERDQDRAWLGTTETYDRARIKTHGRAGQLVSGQVTGMDGELLVVNT